MSFFTQHEPESPAHNSALAIYQTSSSADEAIKASPLGFELEVGKPGSTPLHSTTSTPDEADQAAKQQETYVSEKTASSLEYDDVSDEVYTGSGHSNWSGIGSSEAATFQGLGGSKKWGATLAPTSTTHEIPPNTSPSFHEPSQSTPNPIPVYSPGATPDIPIPSASRTFVEPAEPEFREFQLRISRSRQNHRDYIERQGYYGGFNPDRMSIMAEDLLGRVPMEAMTDCQLSKPEVPLWVKDMKTDRVTRKRVSLRQMWEEGKRGKRGDVKPTVGA